MGPIIEPANGKLLNALTTLGDGETWAVKPQKLDETGRLWSPGIRFGVKRGSYFHLTEFFGPVLGTVIIVLLPEWLRFMQNWYLAVFGFAVGGRPATSSCSLDRKS